jgi:molybdopterin molybdotransferase
VADDQANEMTSMQSIESYRAEVLEALTPIQAEEIALTDADGAVLAADVAAAWPLPGFDNSGMDGYAVLAADVATASTDHPITLPVIAEVAAGDTTGRALTAGHSFKIMTGALLPADADAVVPVEWTDGDSETVTITQPVEKGHAVRRAGDDAKPGDMLLPAGTKLGPAQIGVLAASGQGAVLARRRPRVTVISTGNELAEPGSPLVPGLIWDSNSYMLAAAARQAGCEVVRHGVVRDDPAAVLATVELAAATADMLITSGGVSMGGEHDAVKAALTILGTVNFRKVAMQPGMPQGFGLLGSPPRTPIFTLPGNPVSALVSFHVFVTPAIRALQELPADKTELGWSTLAAPVTSPAGRRSYLRGILDPKADAVIPLTGQSSHHIANLARADVLIIVPEDVTALPAGTQVRIMDLP